MTAVGNAMTNTRKDVLVALREKVQAGDDVSARDASRVWPNGYAHAVNAGVGSLDAAKALHEAVLPGWNWATWGDGAEVWEKSGDNGDDDVLIADNPARAWLIAILNALISEIATDGEGA